jgi:hypothetical protein
MCIALQDVHIAGHIEHRARGYDPVRGMGLCPHTSAPYCPLQIQALRCTDYHTKFKEFINKNYNRRATGINLWELKIKLNWAKHDTDCYVCWISSEWRIRYCLFKCECT